MNQPLSMDQVFLNKVTTIIEANLDNEKFGAEELSHEIGMSRSNINRRLKSLQKNSISQLIQTIRLQRAMEMLRQKVATASEVAFRVGFTSPTYFNKCFRDFYGFPPGEVKKIEEFDREIVKQIVTPELISSNTIPTEKNIKLTNRKKLILWIIFSTLIVMLLLFSLFLFFNDEIFQHSSKADNIMTKDAKESIAVLPFKNLSLDPAQEYVSDGMTEEILSHLFMIGGLKITSGTSAMRFKGSKLPVRDIARELGVRYVLEGSVSQTGDNVRIIARLVDGKNEDLVWTNDYYRSMTVTDLHDIQSDVAQRVAENMHVVVNPEVKQRMERIPTKSTEAYTLFLQTKDWQLNLEQSEIFLNKAIQLDPNFADAYGVLAYRYLWGLLLTYDTISRQQILDKVEPLVNKAFQVDKNSIYTHITFIELQLFYYWDFKTVEAEYQYFSRMFPSNPDFYYLFTEYLIAAERFREAYYLNKDGFSENDFTESKWIFMALSAYFYGQLGEANATIDKALQVISIDRELLKIALRLMIYLSRYEDAVKLFEDNALINLDRVYTPCLGSAGIAYFKTGNKQKADIILDILISKSKKSPFKYGIYDAATIYASMGKSEKAIGLLEIAFDHKDPNLFFLKIDPLFLTLHGDPRFEALLSKIGFNKALSEY
jgi:TolB-like protein/AraC-like DNA-binding protein